MKELYANLAGQSADQEPPYGGYPSKGFAAPRSAQGDSFAMLITAPMRNHYLIIPLLRMVRCSHFHYNLCRCEAAEWMINMPETQTEDAALQAAQTAPQADAQPTLSFTEEPAGMISLLQKIQADTAAQAADSKKRLMLARISTAALVMLLAVVISAIITLMPRVNGVLAQTTAVLDDAKVITQQVVDANIPGILQNINQLVSESKTGVTQALTELQTALQKLQTALQKLQGIDITGLNKAIADLSNIVAPMARLFGG